MLEMKPPFEADVRVALNVKEPWVIGLLSKLTDSSELTDIESVLRDLHFMGMNILAQQGKLHFQNMHS